VFEQRLRRDLDISPKIIDEPLGMVDNVRRIFFFVAGRAAAPFAKEFFRDGEVAG
jgi:hypothetical protein